MTAAWTQTYATHAGPFCVIATEGDLGDTVLASGWTADPEALRALVAPTLRPDTLLARTGTHRIGEAVLGYHQGQWSLVEGIPVQQRSGPYRERAWQVLRTVPAGRRLTYAEFAELTDRPSAVRAAAGACASNAAALFVPCHRVVRTGGGLGGFRWGLTVKEWLLHHESGGPDDLSGGRPR